METVLLIIVQVVYGIIQYSFTASLKIDEAVLSATEIIHVAHEVPWGELDVVFERGVTGVVYRNCHTGLIAVNLRVADRVEYPAAHCERGGAHGVDGSGLGIERIGDRLARGKREADISRHRGGVFEIQVHGAVARHLHAVARLPLAAFQQEHVAVKLTAAPVGHPCVYPLLSALAAITLQYDGVSAQIVGTWDGGQCQHGVALNDHLKIGIARTLIIKPLPGAVSSMQPAAAANVISAIGHVIIHLHLRKIIKGTVAGPQRQVVGAAQTVNDHLALFIVKRELVVVGMRVLARRGQVVTEHRRKGHRLVLAREACLAWRVHGHERQPHVGLIRCLSGIGLHAHHYGLAHGVAVGTGRAADALVVGRHDRKHEITVVHATPSPVHVEASVAVIAVTHPLVATGKVAVVTAHHERMALGQLRVDKVFPSVVGIVVVNGVIQIGIVVEIIDKCRRAIAAIGT